MSVRKEVYIIFGLKLNGQITEEYWEKDFRGETEWNENKPKNKPFFITDGMNGDYTFFGFIQEINNGKYDFEEEITEIKYDYNAEEVIEEFKKLFPEITANEWDVKLYYVPHFV
jgi:hypothetical protein